MFHYTEQLHVKKSKEEVKQLLLEFKFDIQFFRYYGEEVAEDRIRLIPKKTEFMGSNSYIPIVNCFLICKEEGTDIKLLFDLDKWCERFLSIAGIVLFLMEIGLFMSGAVFVGLMGVAVYGINLLIGKLCFQKSAERVVKKIMEVLGE